MSKRVVNKTCQERPCFSRRYCTFVHPFPASRQIAGAREERKRSEMPRFLHGSHFSKTMCPRLIEMDHMSFYFTLEFGRRPGHGHGTKFQRHIWHMLQRLEVGMDRGSRSRYDYFQINPFSSSQRSKCVFDPSVGCQKRVGSGQKTSIWSGVGWKGAILIHLPKREKKKG